MNRWFIDASALLAGSDSGSSEHAAALSLIERDGLFTIDLAYYETTNVTAFKWADPSRATQIRHRMRVIERLGRLVRVDDELAAAAAQISTEYRISGYDASYVAGARRTDLQLVSCDVRDLVSNGLAITPTQAVAADASDDG